MSKRSWGLAAALAALWLLPSLAGATEAALKATLPGKELAGWKAVAGTYLYAAGNDLTKIYDGGYETYLKAGVTEAVQQTYQGPGTLTVTAHALRSPKEAAAFFATQRPDRQPAAGKPPKVTVTAGGKAFFFTAQGVTTIAARGPKTVTTASLFGMKPAPAAVTAMAADLAKRAR